jgi:uncharacterized protein
MQNVAKRRFILYLALLLVFTVGVNFVAASAGSSPAASLLIMWSPALAAIVASILTRRSLKKIGWRPWPVRWLAAGWVFPILYAFPAYALVWAAGLGRVPNPTFLERARLTLNMPAGPNWLVIVAAFGFISVVNLLPAMVLSLGEEIGWRGFLVPELTGWVGFRKASILSGSIWCAWHLPGILSGAYGDANTPLAYRLVCFAAMVVGSGVILGWLRMRSGSIWPAAVMHATHNGIIQAFFDRITADTGYTRYFTGEFGVAMVPFVLALAWYCWRRTDNVEIASAEDDKLR